MRSFDAASSTRSIALSGQEAIGDVAVREHRRRDERRVLELHAVMDLVALAQAAQDADRVFDRRLADHHRLEAALERRVLLDVLRGTRRAWSRRSVCSSPRASIGFSMLRRVHRAFGRAGADDGVELVDEEDDLALRRR